MERMTIDARSAGLGLLVGGVCGGAVGYLLCRHAMRRATEAEIQSVKDHYKALADNIEESWKARIDSLSSLVQDRDQPEDNTTSGDNDDGREATVGTPYKPVPAAQTAPDPDDPRLEGIDDEEAEEAGDEHEFPEPEPDALPHDRDITRPYVISLPEFCDDVGPEWQKVTVTYYALDKVLVDDKEQPVRDIAGTTGPLDPLKFGGISEDPHIRYVRNYKLKIDFEIILDMRAFTDAVLNYGNPVRGSNS